MRKVQLNTFHFFFPLRIVFEELKFTACLVWCTHMENMAMIHLKAVFLNSVLSHESEDIEEFYNFTFNCGNQGGLVGLVTLITHFICAYLVF